MRRNASHVLNARVTKVQECLSTLSEELHEPTHEFVNGQQLVTSIPAQLKELESLYQSKILGSSALYSSSVTPKKSADPLLNSAKKRLSGS